MAKPRQWLEEAKRLRAAGKTLDEIGKAVGRCLTTVRTALIESGIDTHPLQGQWHNGGLGTRGGRYYEGPCGECGKPLRKRIYHPTATGRYYCDRECSRKSWSAAKKQRAGNPG